MMVLTEATQKGASSFPGTPKTVEENTPEEVSQFFIHFILLLFGPKYVTFRQTLVEIS